MEKSIKRVWKVSSVLMTLAIAMGLLSMTVFADSVSDSFEDETKIASKSNVEVAGGQVKLTSSAAELDQHQTVHEDKWHDIHGKKWYAQSFVAGEDGDLKKVVLYLKKKGTPPAPLAIELRNFVTGGETYDVPGEDIKYTSEISQGVISDTGGRYEVTLSTPVTLGICYTIVLHQKNDGGSKDNKYQWSENTEDEYGPGNNSKADDGGATWKRGGPGHDQYFETYVGDQLDQHQTVHEDKWHDIHGKKWYAQSFVAGEDGDLKKVVLYLKKKGTPPAPLAIELRNFVTGGETYDVPGEDIKYTSEISQGVISDTGGRYEVTLSTPVTLGICYTIVLHQKNDGGSKDNKYQWSENTEDEYGPGNNSKADDGGATWKRGVLGTTSTSRHMLAFTIRQEKSSQLIYYQARQLAV